MSKLVSQRVGIFRVPIGVALLRNIKVAQVPENWIEEGLDGKYDLYGSILIYRPQSADAVSIAFRQ
jgi:hypothetical protein